MANMVNTGHFCNFGYIPHFAQCGRPQMAFVFAASGAGWDCRLMLAPF